jgi:hypothetical protein
MVTYTIKGIHYNVISLEMQSWDWEKMVEDCIDSKGGISIFSAREQIQNIMKLRHDSFLFADIENETVYYEEINIDHKQAWEIKKLFVIYFKSLFLERVKQAQNYINSYKAIKFSRIF